MPFDDDDDNRLSLLVIIWLVRSWSPLGDEVIDGLNDKEMRLAFIEGDGEGERGRLTSLLPFV